MNTAATNNWHEANQDYLSAALANVRRKLERHARMKSKSAGDNGDDGERTLLHLKRDEALPVIEPPPALESLVTTLHLSPFERDILLLCAGMELDASFALLCAQAMGELSRPYPTFSLALAAFPDAHWSALSPDAPLRRWRLIEIGSSGSGGLVFSQLRIDEWALHYLVGVPYLDERLSGFFEPLRGATALVPSQLALAEGVAATWKRSGGMAVVQLCGSEYIAKRAIAAAACALVEVDLFVLSAELVPTQSGDLDALIRLWERHAALSQATLMLECGDLDAADTAREHAITRLIERLDGLLIVASRERRHIQYRQVITFDVHKPTLREQRAIWQGVLGDHSQAATGQVDALVSQFDLSAATIYSVGAEAREQPDRLWDACRAQTRPRMSDLAQRIESNATWNDIVLPEAQMQSLREIAAQVRQRVTVYDTWGFGALTTRGLGISSLFVGSSGTGKTLAAEVLANELRLDLYRIDLSSVVSKYIGETEKNLRRVFDAAEDGGAVLLFDEADALFGKRSEVKDSHDRYANIEVSYLLQRMETYRGLAILTTNMKNAIDPAFLRRIRFIVSFPFPDIEQRAEIWQRIFPPETPTDSLDVTKLARLNIAGGNIRNIALNAAFLAAHDEKPVGMLHLLRAAQGEYAKLENVLTDAEIGGWV